MTLKDQTYEKSHADSLSALLWAIAAWKFVVGDPHRRTVLWQRSWNPRNMLHVSLGSRPSGFFPPSSGGGASQPPRFSSEQNFDENMFKGSASSSAGPARSAGTGALPAQGGATGKDKLESKLLALLMNANVKEETLNKLGDNDVNTVLLYANIGTDKESFKKFLELPEIDVKGDTLAGMTEQAKLIGVWRALQTVVEVEDKASAERQQLNLPPTLSKKDIDILRKLFENSAEGFPVAKSVCPSKPYFQRKVAEIENGFEAEHLTSVTTDDQDSGDGAPDGLAGFDMTLKTFRVSQKEIRISLPTGPEGLRSRIKTMGLAFIFLKLKYPNKGVLRTATMQLFFLYTEFLFGPDVWGKATLGLDGKPIATPHIQHVMIYDNAIRKRVAELMNDGKDIWSAFGEATADEGLKTTHFYGNVSMDLTSAKCRAITAPGLASERAVEGVPTKGANSEGREGSATSKAEKKKAQKARQKAKKEQEKAAKAAAAKGQVIKKPKALLNGGVGDGNPKGKGRGKLMDKTPDGDSICFKWSAGKPCASDPCPHKHVCRKCGGAHKMSDPACPLNKAGN